MDTIPAQPVQDAIQQVPVQPAPTFTSSSTQELPQKKKSFRKFFNISSWIVLFALLPLTVLIFLSQNTIPGDLFYPVKRSLENVILAAASVSPATRAAFRTDLTQARFKEAQSLVVSKSNASGLTTFVDEVQSTQLEVVSLKSDTERKKAEEKLISKIEEYQSSLSTLEAKTEQNLITYRLQEIPTSTPIPITTAPNQNQISPSFPSPTPTLTPSPIPTKIPISASTSLSLPSSKPQPTPTLTPIPTLTISPTIALTVPLQQENTQVTEQKKIAQTIKQAKTSLEKIKKDLEENKSEDRQKKNMQDENETSNKQDSNKKTETPNRKK